MKSVKSIQKITKAMKMVAASKLRGVQTKAEQSRGLWQPFTALLGDASTSECIIPCSFKNFMVVLPQQEGAPGGRENTKASFVCLMPLGHVFALPFPFLSAGAAIGPASDKSVIVAVSTDRGLCGGINSTVVKHVRALDHIETHKGA